MKSRHIALLTMMLAALGLFACNSSDDGMGSGQGQVRFVMSSAPAPVGTLSADGTVAIAGAGGTVSPLDDDDDDGDDDRPQLQAANVTFTSFLARNLEGELISVGGDLPFTTDVLQVVHGREVSLPAGFLPPGTYDQLVVVMSTVELVTQNGTKIAITPPGGGWTSIVNVQDPFTVVEGQTTTINLRFKWWRAFRRVNDEIEFAPEFDCDHD